MMNIRANQHQRRVDKPRETSKDTFEIGEIVWVQDFKSRRWDKEGTISNVRPAYDGKIVSYELILNGANAIRHRRYLRKKLESDDHDTEHNDTASQTGLERTAADLAPRRSCRQAARQLKA